VEAKGRKREGCPGFIRPRERKGEVEGRTGVRGSRRLALDGRRPSRKVGLSNGWEIEGGEGPGG
jgi:hypothetical protein